MNGISSKALNNSPANKYKFNGIEQNNDFDLNMYDAFYRNLDPQIGRFWQPDPVTTHDESVYAVMQNNPISKTDWLGDYFTWANGAESTYNKMREENNKRMGGYLSELISIMSSGEKGMGKQINQLATLINMHAELNSQWNEMETSDVEFHLSLDAGVKGGPEGQTGYNADKNRIDIQLFGKNGNKSSVAAHEIRHGYGYLTGELMGTRNGNDPLYDVTDEVVAKKAGSLFLDRKAANDVANGYFTPERFVQFGFTPGSTYDKIKDRKISLTLNTAAAVFLKYSIDSYITSYINRNSSNANLTVQDAMKASNGLDVKAGRPAQYIFGDALKNRKQP